MTSSTRCTVARPVRYEGTGIHTGKPCSLEIRPGGAGQGILLRRAGTVWPDLPACIEHANAEKSDRRTVLTGPAGQTFEQLEHVMAALAAAGITDALLVQDGLEPPFLDGGSREYMEGLLTAGREELVGELEPLVIREPIHLNWEGAELVATPHEGLRLSCYVEFPGTVVGSQGASVEITPESFRDEVAAARTFALERDIEALRAAGLAKGGTLQNAVVFNESRYLNDSLFFEDEVARHKILDLLGDLALIGRPLRGHFWAWKAGHRHHIHFARLIAKGETR
ncbi:MAG: hypothetical protein PWP23_238 [Candidatus Sumerlaeota bacterium]|nr:hypothetical protein [Candidatus Sumerlaeota bacterium]